MAQMGSRASCSRGLRTSAGSFMRSPALASRSALLLVSQHLAQQLCGGSSPGRLASLDSVMPVGVGGVMIMAGTLRCLLFTTGVWLLPLLTHDLKPFRQENLSPMFSSF